MRWRVWWSWCRSPAISLTGQTPATTSKVKRSQVHRFEIHGRRQRGNRTSHTMGRSGSPGHLGSSLYGRPSGTLRSKCRQGIPDRRGSGGVGQKERVGSWAQRPLLWRPDVSGAYNAVFNSVLRTGKRTSMIIDPPDGKIPPLVAGAQGAGRPVVPPGRPGGGRAPGAPPGVAPPENDNPEFIAQSPRCLGVPMPFLPLNTLFCSGHGDADRAVPQIHGDLHGG